MRGRFVVGQTLGHKVTATQCRDQCAVWQKPPAPDRAIQPREYPFQFRDLGQVVAPDDVELQELWYR